MGVRAECRLSSVLQPLVNNVILAPPCWPGSYWPALGSISITVRGTWERVVIPRWGQTHKKQTLRQDPVVGLGVGAGAGGGQVQPRSGRACGGN